MPPKQDPQPEIKPDKPVTGVICGVLSPGPKYHLKTLVGYQKHCLSKLRYPAYSFGQRLPSLKACEGPGPKYLLKSPKQEGFSFGYRLKSLEPFCTPGPKYVLPDAKGLRFSIKFRTKPRGDCFTPGPYNVKHVRDSPAYSMGIRTALGKCDPVPGPHAFSVDLVTPRAPIYSLSSRTATKESCRSPGPKYHPKLPRPTPIYSFGTKHSECAPPYIVECDDKC